MSNKIKGSIVLLITAILWGTTFVAQKKAGDVIDPFAFNAVRSLVALPLLFILFIFTKNKIKNNDTDESGNAVEKKKVYLFSILAGVFLFLASSFQQISIGETNASIVAFLTSTYMIFVPIIGFFFKQKVRRKVWICAGIAIIGSLLLSNTGNGFGEFKLSWTFIFALLGSVFYAFQIISIDKVNKNINPFLFCLIQSSILCLGSFIIAIIRNALVIDNIKSALPYILYAGILSSCVAYSLQIIGQKYSEPTIASIIMSLESVFALISSVIILHEVLNVYEIIGTILIFASVVGSQVDVDLNKFKKKTS